jgi:hypothetical protein
VQRPQINSFEGRESRLAFLKLALDLTAFDPDKMLACLDVRAWTDQQRGDCSSRSRSKRQDITASLDPPLRGLGSGRSGPLGP